MKSVYGRFLIEYLNKNLSNAAIKTYIYISSFTSCFSLQKTIAKEIGVKDHQVVSNAVNELKNINLIDVQIRPHTSNKYTIKIKRGSFGLVDLELLKNKEIKFNDLRVYIYLQSIKHFKKIPTIETIMNICALSKNAVYKSLRTLKRLNLYTTLCEHESCYSVKEG